MATKNFNPGDQVLVQGDDGEDYPGVVLEITPQGEYRVSHMFTGVSSLVAGGRLAEPVE